MGNKEEIKPTILEAVPRGKSSSARSMTGFEELLTVMSKEQVKPQPETKKTQPETKKPHKTHWQQIFMACFCILAIAAGVEAFLYLDTEISNVQSAVGSVIKEFNTLNAQGTAAGTKEQLAAVTAEIKDLKATNTQLRAEVKELREALEALKAKKNNVVPAQQKRR